MNFVTSLATRYCLIIPCVFSSYQQPMGIPVQNTHVYSLNFADDQVLIAQDHDDMEFMARKLKEEYEK